MTDSLKNKPEEQKTRRDGTADNNDISSSSEARPKRRPNLTPEEIKGAYGRVAARGEKPTVLKVYQELGCRGSLTTINRFCVQLEAERQQRELALKENGINREEVRALAEELVEKAYCGNIEMVRRELGRSAEAIENCEQKKQLEIKELCAQYDELEHKHDDLAEHCSRLSKRLTEVEKQLSELNSELLGEQAKTEAYRKLADEMRSSAAGKGVKELKELKEMVQQLMLKLK